MRKIKIYKSFEEQERDKLNEILSIDPMERISAVVKLIKKVYHPLPSGSGAEPKRIRFIKI